MSTCAFLPKIQSKCPYIITLKDNTKKKIGYKQRIPRGNIMSIVL